MQPLACAVGGGGGGGGEVKCVALVPSHTLYSTLHLPFHTTPSPRPAPRTHIDRFGLATRTCISPRTNTLPSVRSRRPTTSTYSPRHASGSKGMSFVPLWVAGETWYPLVGCARCTATWRPSSCGKRREAARGEVVITKLPLVRFNRVASHLLLQVVTTIPRATGVGAAATAATRLATRQVYLQVHLLRKFGRRSFTMCGSTLPRP